MAKDSNVAIVEINKKYFVEVDLLGNFTAKVNDFVIDKKTEEKKPAEKLIGYYTSMENAMCGIYNDMCARKVVERKRVQLEDWINIIRENKEEVQTLLRNLN